MNAGESFDRIEDLRAWLERGDVVSVLPKPTETPKPTEEAKPNVEPQPTQATSAPATYPSPSAYKYPEYDDTRYKYTNKQPTEKDRERIEKILMERISWKRIRAAQNMAKRITDPNKAFRRVGAAETVYRLLHPGDALRIAEIFYRRYLELTGRA